MKKSQTSRMAFPFSILCLIPITALNTWAADATYQYYRFTTTQTAGETLIQVSEFDLIDGGNKVDYTNLTVTNPGGNSPLGEEPPKIIDGDINTKWLSLNFAPLVFTFNGPVTIDSYNFATANDALGRTPISWTFEGSNNGATWVEIDSRSSVTPRGSFFTFFNNAFELPNLSTAPTGVSDNYTLQEETVLVAATSVLSNDFGGGGALTAVLETGPSNGQLLFNSDGTFTYLPDLDFAGQDSFTYRASGGLAPVIFNVDPAQSSANINASLGTSFGSDSSSDSSKFSGTMRANLSPSSLPYNEIQIDDLNLRLDDDLRFRFRFAFGIAGVDADINGGAVSILMNTPGSPSAVDANGGFSQTGNELRIVGIATVNGTGLASGAVPSGPQNLDTPVSNVDLTGTIVENGGILTLTIPLNFSGSFDFDGNSLELAISGTVVATAPLPSPTGGGEQSARPPVTLNVFEEKEARLLGEGVYY
ncbi:MAG: cadherin-like domain-containing protein [Verrucomicrobiaceae bacterium]|nr:cadherin-like domain-containing protein [Verrucomicrobiaceae bacterium]